MMNVSGVVHGKSKSRGMKGDMTGLMWRREKEERRNASRGNY
jgi:hypothetical protein